MAYHTARASTVSAFMNHTTTARTSASSQTLPHTMAGALPMPTAPSTPAPAPVAGPSDLGHICSTNRLSTNNPAPAKISMRTKLRTGLKPPFKAIGRAVKRVFKFGSAKKNANNRPTSTFVASSEFQRPTSRSSVRSRRPTTAAKMTSIKKTSKKTKKNSKTGKKTTLAATNNTNKRNSTPSIMVTSPTVHGRPNRQTLILHNYDGPSAPLSAVRRKSMRFSLPATTAVLSAPATPMTFLTTDSSESEAERNSSFVGSVTEMISQTANSTPAASPTAADFAGQVDPHKLFRISYGGKQLEGNAEMFSLLCNQLDGLKRR